MASWPSNWINQALTAAGIPVTGDTIQIMLSWKDSTPLPPWTNNPIGMPVHSSGAQSYMKTRYAMFPAMSAFYAAFAAFAASDAGRKLATAMTADSPYPGTWRAISALKWPGSDTETDYPSAVLDLTDQSYRDSVGAASPGARRTSGQVGGTSPAKADVIANAKVAAAAVTAISNAGAAMRYALQRSRNNG